MPIVMTRRQWAAMMAAPALSSRPLRAAAFRADATPPLGEPLIWVTPAKEVLDPLWAKGIVLDDGQQRIVLCAVDWCGIGGATHLHFRTRIALTDDHAPHFGFDSVCIFAEGVNRKIAHGRSVISKR